MGTIREKCPKQGLTIAEDLTMYVYIYMQDYFITVFIEVLIDEDELPDVCLLEEDE